MDIKYIREKSANAEHHRDGRSQIMGVRIKRGMSLGEEIGNGLKSSAGLLMSEEAKQDKIARFAEVAVRVGLGIQRGQEVVMTAPLEALPLARRITEHAYRAGASLVTTLFTDEEATLMRFRYAPDDSFDRAAEWLYEGMASAYRRGAARLAISGGNPALLSGQDPEKVSRANLAMSKASRPALDLITRHEINWSIVACATPAWARSVFPDESEEIAIARLWDAIFSTCRIDTPDPVAAWLSHDANLAERARVLNARRFAALHFRGPGTDLHVGLADDHVWMGGGTTARNGVRCIPNLPTEEVFTTPHKDRVNGRVTSTKPLSYQGMLIKDIQVQFENGRIVTAKAADGESILQNMLNTDEGARRLGEVALVPHSSPVSK
ncbi:MAG TPA: aminopeptidase, partial [Tepidisphaeraceae bacterium]|nr:aminopeptidase [Tepidisphaeraceae bacterium]